MLVGDFEEITSIQFADFGRGFAEHKTSQFAPPILVVVFAWASTVPSGTFILRAISLRPIPAA